MNRLRRILNFRFRRVVTTFERFTHRWSTVLGAVADVVGALAVTASLACLVLLVIHVGFDHSVKEYHRLASGINAVRAVFLVNIVTGFVLRPNVNRSVLKRIVDVAALLAIVSMVVPRPVHPWFPMLVKVLYSHYFIYPAMAAYAVVELSYAVMAMMGRRTNPALMLSGSFIVFILIGSFVLMLPKCTYGSISYVDALFVSTSAVCITGLTPIDVSVHFTPLGLAALACLIQIGGLGVLTFTGFFALFFTGNQSVSSQLMVRDLVYSKSMSSLLPTLLYVFLFTVVIELVGAVMIFVSIHGSLVMSTRDEVWTSVFNSISAFCNAGFSNISGGMGNGALLSGNQAIYWVISALVVCGSIGFPILVNYKDMVVKRIKYRLHRLTGRHAAIRPVHLYDMNTKIVLATFGLLFVAGAVVFALFEWNHSLAGMSGWERISQSVFNSVTPRSAGFSSVPPSGFLNVTLVVVMFLMWVGGASQSTGGGIKVNTFAAAWLSLWATIRGRSEVNAFGRRISVPSLRRAHAVIILSLLMWVALVVALLLMEPSLAARDLVFEATSALFTVGSSLGVTPQLGEGALLLLCVAMFVGRVGMLSLLAGLMSTHGANAVKYPTGDIIIN